MRSEHAVLVYRASGSLAEAPVVWVEDDAGRPLAHLERHGHARRWAWSGAGVPEFVVEEMDEPGSSLLTRPDGAPFGRVMRRGRLRPRLEVMDADGPRFVVEADGHLANAGPAFPGAGTLGRIEVTAPWEVVVDLRMPWNLDPTHGSLLLASPLCQAALQAPLRH